MSADTLWYATPAERWQESLLLGNGRLGASASERACGAASTAR